MVISDDQHRTLYVHKGLTDWGGGGWYILLEGRVPYNPAPAL